jgi:hypothetical protein
MKRRAGWITLSASALLFSCLSVQPAEAQDCRWPQQELKLITGFSVQHRASSGLVTAILDQCVSDRYQGARVQKIVATCELYDARMEREYAQLPAYQICEAHNPATTGPKNYWCHGTATVCK